VVLLEAISDKHKLDGLIIKTHINQQRVFRPCIRGICFPYTDGLIRHALRDGSTNDEDLRGWMQRVQNDSEVVSGVCERFWAALQIYDCSHSVRSMFERHLHLRSDVTVHTEGDDADGLHAEGNSSEKIDECQQHASGIELTYIYFCTLYMIISFGSSVYSYQHFSFGSEEPDDTEALGV
jgi:hypothetical protein